MKKIISFLFFILFALCTHGQNSYSVLSAFNFTNGAYPYGDLISDGTYLYGMTTGGNSNGFSGSGVIFKIKPDGTGYFKLHDFDGTNGGVPYGSLISDGTYLYGMAQQGGAFNGGVVFKIKPDGTGYTVLFSLSGTNGSIPYSSLNTDSTYLYGMTWYGGANNAGVIFKIKTDGSSYTKLLDFNGSNGANPYFNSLIIDGTYLYGMSQYGGSNNDGVVFKVKKDGTGYTKLLDFNGMNGEQPAGSLISDGTYLYGMTNLGGSNNKGVVFKLKHDGTGYVNLLNFNGTNGSGPSGSLIRTGSYLYGMTNGGGAFNKSLIFKIRPDGTDYANLHDFDGTNGGAPSFGSLISDGTCLYGMTHSSGNGTGYGVVFRLCMPCRDHVINNLQSICAGGSYIINNHTYTLAGSYNDTLQAMLGCDSIIITQLTVSECLGFKDLKDENERLRIYPNPTAQFLNIELRTINEKQTKIYVYDISGREVIHNSIFNLQHSVQLDVSDLNRGMYFVKVGDESRRFAKE